MRNFASGACAFLLLAGAASAQIGAKERVKSYENKLWGKATLAGTFAGAALGEARNSPSEYGRTTEGFAKRWGSRLAQNGVKQTIVLGASAWHHEDLRYVKSNRNGIVARAFWAAKRTFIVPYSNREGSTLALGRIAGAFGAGQISRTWQPASVSGIGQGFQSGGLSLAIDAGLNVVREFWPKKK
jgi:hypothetical protein